MAATSKYVPVESPAASTTADQPQALIVPSEIRVSMPADPWRALRSAERWKPSPATNTTGVESASATHSQPENRSEGTIASRTTGTVRHAASASRRRRTPSSLVL